jgi:hypothetical protein
VSLCYFELDVLSCISQSRRMPLMTLMRFRFRDPLRSCLRVRCPYNDTKAESSGKVPILILKTRNPDSTTGSPKKGSILAAGRAHRGLWFSLQSQTLARRDAGFLAQVLRKVAVTMLRCVRGRDQSQSSQLIFMTKSSSEPPRKVAKASQEPAFLTVVSLFLSHTRWRH